MPSAGPLFCRPFDVSLSEPCEVIPGSGFDWHCFRNSRYGVYFQVLLDFKQCEYYCPPEIGFLKGLYSEIFWDDFSRDIT